MLDTFRSPCRLSPFLGHLCSFRFVRILTIALASTVVGGCQAPTRDAVASLGELYASRSDEPSRSGERATYAIEVIDRGFWARSGQSLDSLIADPDPLAEREPMGDPVAFALEALARIERSQPGDLDTFERASAIAIVAKMAWVDRSRILRARALQIAVGLVAAAELPVAPFRLLPVDEAALKVGLDATFELADALPDRRAPLVQTRAADLARGAALLQAQRPESFNLARKLLLLAAKSGRRVEDAGGAPELITAYRAAAEQLAGHVAFLVARPDLTYGRGAIDPADDVRIAAGRLLFAVDPVAATVELGKVWGLGLSSLVRVAWLQAFVSSRLAAVNVDTSLRSPLEQELIAEDASVGLWARRALAHLLGLDPATATITDLRARWLALGDFNPVLAPAAASPAE